MNTHSKTCVLGNNVVMFSQTGRICDFYPYSNTYKATKDIPNVSDAIAIQNEETSEVVILVINKGLW
jgi:hypothetical protein